MQQVKGYAEGMQSAKRTLLRKLTELRHFTVTAQGGDAAQT